MTKESTQRMLRLTIFVVFAVGIIAFTTLRVIHPLSVRAGSGVQLSAASKEKARRLLLDGVGTQVTFASEGAGLDQVQASVGSLQSFVHDRSGLLLEPEPANKLAAMEQRTLNGAERRITCDELSDTALAILVERFRHSSDAESEKAADGLMNVKTVNPGSSDHITLVSGSSTGTSSKRAAAVVGVAARSTDAADRVMLRADGRGVMTRGDLVEQAEQYRTRMNVPAQLIAILGILRPAVRQAFRNRLIMLSQALPEQWGTSPTDGLTPVQAFVLTYSVAADDPLYRSNQGLQTAMQWVEAVNRQSGGAYPSSAGRLPYGSNGYLFSSPVSLFFDKPTTNRLLDKLAERTSK